MDSCDKIKTKLNKYTMTKEIIEEVRSYLISEKIVIVEPNIFRAFVEFVEKDRTKQLSIPVVVKQSEQLVCGSKCDYDHEDGEGNELYCCVKVKTN